MTLYVVCVYFSIFCHASVKRTCSCDNVGLKAQQTVCSANSVVVDCLASAIQAGISSFNHITVSLNYNLHQQSVNPEGNWIQPVASLLGNLHLSKSSLLL